MSIKTRARQYGEIFEGWKIGELVGKGKEGQKTAVYRLTKSNLTFEEESAMKVINIIESDYSADNMSDTYKKEFEMECKVQKEIAEREVKVMYELRGCSNVVNCQEHFFKEWREIDACGWDLIIRMDYLDNIRKNMNTGKRYTDEEIVKIGMDICNALLRCHKSSIMHRDIKPDNIFINKGGDYLLGDFGISRILNNSQKAETSTGTRYYAAPEQFKGEYDYRVDIYSLGLTLYELANDNRLPFASSAYVREEELLLRIRGDKLPAPVKSGEKLTKIILKACEYNPDDRYQTADEFLSALAHFNEDACIGNKLNKKTYIENQGGNAADMYATLPAIGSNTKKDGIIIESKSIDEQAGKDELKLGNWYYDMGEYERAAQFFLDSAIKGNEEAQYYISICYYLGHGVNRDYAEAVKWSRRSAEKENALAQFNLGLCYDLGEGVEQNYIEAVKWYKRSAENNVTEAQCNLANCYYIGKGVDRNYDEAVKWYKKSAKGQNARGQLGLGECYYNGKGVERNYNEAAKWYRKSAEQGNADAQYILGYCCQYGIGVIKSYIEAVKWYRKSAMGGNSEAQFNMGEYYNNKNHVLSKGRNYREALRYYEMSAEQGNPAAKYRMGQYYCWGRGVDIDMEEGEKWIRESAEQGYKKAADFLENWLEYNR